MSRNESIVAAPFFTWLFGAITIAAIYGGFDGRPEAELHYAPAENLEWIDIELIASAREKIDLAAYVLTDVAIIDNLTVAAQRGVKIRLYRDGAEREQKPFINQALDRLAAEPNVEQRFKSDADAPMHLKSYCVDDKTLRSGAANFSASGLKRQDNDLFVLRGPRACAGFERHFERMWSRK